MLIPNLKSIFRILEIKYHNTQDPGHNNTRVTWRIMAWHQKGVTSISIKIVFAVDDLRYYRKKCHSLHHRAGLHYPIFSIFFSYSYMT